MDEDHVSSHEPAPSAPSAGFGRGIDMGPLIRGLSAESRELELARRRLLREVEIAIVSAQLRVEDALAEAPPGAVIDVAVACRSPMQVAVQAALARLQAANLIEVNCGQAHRGPRFRR